MGEKVFKYDNEVLYKMGQVHKALLHLLNGGHEFVGNPDILPYKAFIRVYMNAMRANIKIPKRLDREIGNLMDKINEDDMEFLMTTPVPMKQRSFYLTGCMNYQKLLIKHPIALLRHNKNMTQNELANQMGVSQKDISRWENFVCMPNPDNLKKLSDILGCTIDDLVSQIQDAEK